MEENKIRMENYYKYFAFISYNSKDTEWGKKVQKKLEHYRMPATLCIKHGWERTPIKPVFFAPTDILPGGLTEELQERLKASKNLIVVCSPNSAKSEWVGKEIEFFHQLGRAKQIHFFIIKGQPHSGNPDTECFNPIIDTLGLPEILGANIHERTQSYPFTNISCSWLDKERAYVQLVSKLLGVEFDSIWQRHKRKLVEKIIVWAIGVIFVLSVLIGVWFINQPVNVEVHLNEVSVHNDNLPPLKDAIVTMTLDNEIKTGTVRSLDTLMIFTNIPHRFINKKVRITMECQDYLPVDTDIILNKFIIIDIQRNPDIYGEVHFQLWNTDTEQMLPNAKVMVEGNDALSDDSGYVSLSIPLSEQKKNYSITSKTVLLVDSIKTMPCGPYDLILFK